MKTLHINGLLIQPTMENTYIYNGWEFSADYLEYFLKKLGLNKTFLIELPHEPVQIKKGSIVHSSSSFDYLFKGDRVTPHRYFVAEDGNIWVEFTFGHCYFGCERVYDFLGIDLGEE